MAKVTSQIGLDLIKHFEGFESATFVCASGVYTIGYGHTAQMGGVSVVKGMRITKDKAEKLLKEDLAPFEKAVNDLVIVPISQNKFDALVSLAFNIGISAFASSEVLRAINGEEDMEQIGNAFNLWSYVGGKKVLNLVRRRMAEFQLFCGKTSARSKSTPLGREVKINKADKAFPQSAKTDLS